MLEFSTPDGGRIFLNLSREDRHDFDPPKLDREVQGALVRLSSLHWNKPIADGDLSAADLVFKNGVCLSPFTIFAPLHKEVCVRLNDNSEFVWELREELAAAGAFDFLEGVNDRHHSQGMIERILAVFSCSAFGTTTVENAPRDFIHAVVDLFRTENGLGWNKEILGKNPLGAQCVSNIITGLAKVFNDRTLLSKSRKYRAANGSAAAWIAFEKSTHPLDIELAELHRHFAEDSLMNPQNGRDAVLAISAWMKAAYPGESVLEVVSKPDRGMLFSEYVKKRNNTGATRHTRDLVNYARIFSVSALEQLASRLHGAAAFDLVTQKELNRIKNDVNLKPRPTRSTARPLPEKLLLIAKEILDEGEPGWPGKSGHFDVEVLEGHNLRVIYCPVIPTLLRAMMEIPLRTVQFRRLDSGEGDVIQFNGDKMEWEPNESRLAGYWADQEGEPRENFPTRGYACRIEDGIKTITGIFANTNKTGQPYHLPWCNEIFLKSMWQLRKWQEKYNPISEPLTPDKYLDILKKVPKKTIERMPSIFPIARMLSNKFWPWPGRIVTPSEIDHAWKFLLIELEGRWNDRHPGNLVQLIEINEKTKQPIRPRYSLHGLRRRGLTNLRRGGMPLEMLSRFIAGHATVAMTIYYLDFHPTEIADSIERSLATSAEQRELIDDLKTMEVDEALRRTVSLTPAAVTEAFAAGSQFQFCNTDLGICPYDGTRCGDGGALVRKDSKDKVEKNEYGPVAPRNCVMCRHFISGPPWLNQLVAYGTKLCEQRQYLQREQLRIEDLFVKNEEALKTATISKMDYENMYDTLQVDIIAVKDRQEEVENAIFNVELLSNASVKLLDGQQSDSGLDLVANSRSSVIEFREITEFEQSVRITAAARIHRILGDERVEAKRDRYLNLMLYNSGIAPPTLLTSFSDEHRRKAMDQFAKFILSNTSAEAIDRLVDGDLKMNDLNLEAEARELLEVTLSEPIHLVGAQHPRTPALEVRH